jgi:hypothetical protein
VRSRSAQHVIDLPMRRLDTVKRHRTNNQNPHATSSFPHRGVIYL